MEKDDLGKGKTSSVSKRPAGMSSDPSIFPQNGMSWPRCCWALSMERHSIGKTLPSVDLSF